MISVPLEPTEAMKAAGLRQWIDQKEMDVAAIWSAMCAAAPSPAGGREAPKELPMPPYRFQDGAGQSVSGAAFTPAGGGVEARPVGVDEAMKVNALAKIVRREMQDNSIHIRERSASAVRAILAALSHPVSGGGEGQGSFSKAKIPTALEAENRSLRDALERITGIFVGAPVDTEACNAYAGAVAEAQQIAFDVMASTPAPAVAPSGGAA